MKRLVSLLLVLTMVLAMVPAVLAETGHKVTISGGDAANCPSFEATISDPQYDAEWKLPEAYYPDWNWTAPAGWELIGWKVNGYDMELTDSITWADYEGTEVQLTARWKITATPDAGDYTVVYNPALSTYPSVTAKVTLTEDKFVLPTEMPAEWNGVITGKKLVGWARNPVTEEPVTVLTEADFGEAKSCTVFAVWTDEEPVVSPAVTYEMSGRYYTYTPKASELDEYGNLDVPTPAELGFKDPSGKLFSHWYFENDKTQKYYANSTIPYENKFKGCTLHAVYTSIPVYNYVTFYANDGSCRWESIKMSSLKNSKGKYVLPDAYDLDLDAYWYSKSSCWYYNYNFVCWNTKENGKGTNYYADTAYSSVPTTLYAVWGDKYCALPFVDVDKNAWYYESVCNVYNRGLMNGTSAWTFSPNGLIDRGMVATILWRYAGQPVTYKASPFTDVASNAYYARAIDWAYNTGVVKGTSATTYGPSQNVTRQDLAAILWRYAGCPKSTKSLSSYKDAASISDYAATAMAWAVEKGILNGTNNYLLPKDFATRAQVAAIFARMK